MDYEEREAHEGFNTDDFELRLECLYPVSPRR
jgi:hypothetical protein